MPETGSLDDDSARSHNAGRPAGEVLTGDNLGTMFKITLWLHLLFAVFTIGPLVHAATTAGRTVRRGDRPGAMAAARMLRLYGNVSVLVILAGFAALSVMPAEGDEPKAAFSDTWVWLSLVLWLVAVALVLAVLVPALEQAGRLFERGEMAEELRGRVAAAGGAVGLIFAVVIFLMVYRPGG